MIKDIIKLAFVAFLLYAAASNTAPQTKFLPNCTATLHEWCSTPTKVQCADFPPVDGAGRPAVCDEKD